ncbi:MAG TPA: aminomethyl-transferring glycine dehydrogenase subunit GcvPB [Clostridia bacterium]|nr:aminomethyl-transferring glycine dehydrogenase subunit GcvPB [Clostridia bacterium]
MNRKLIFELSKEGKKGYSLPELDVDGKKIERLIPKELLRHEDARLPEVSEPEVVRYYTGISRLNHGVDIGFYPLGSCTMKYNPKVNEDISRLEGFSGIHPYQPQETVQGCLKLIYELNDMLCEITGMAGVTLQPAAGSHGELTGMMIIKAYHVNNGEGERDKILIPDSAHGTNPSSAAMAGFEVVEVPSNDRGSVDVEALRRMADHETAGLMLTNPNTLGLFEDEIEEIAKIVHGVGGLLYFDGANANAIMGITRPGDMGFDVVHLNLHKTFSTPHGGGGPGSGPVGVVKKLIPYLPGPTVQFDGEKYCLRQDSPRSIGRIRSFFGNFGVYLKAYAYILTMGAAGLRHVSETAVLNANYIMEKLKPYFELSYDRICMHEFVLSANRQKEKGASAMDVSKRLMDFGFHPPTTYFPLIVREALMIEPTETESRETLDEFIDAMIRIAKEIDTDPEKAQTAPHNAPVGRLDETNAARNLRLRWLPDE